MKHALRALHTAALLAVLAVLASGATAALPPPEAAWSTLIPSDDNLAPFRSDARAILDPQRDRMIVMGSGRFQEFEVWTMSLGPSPVWRQRFLFGGPGPNFAGGSAVLDPVRDRILVFGGGSNTETNDVWELSLAEPMTWSRIEPQGAPPPPRSMHSAIYDPVRERMVVFGGTYTGLNDTWALSLAGTPAWEKLEPTGALPETRFGNTAIYDPAGDRMLILGGFHYALPPTGGTVPQGVWALSLAGVSHWELLAAPGGPAALSGHHAEYDAARHRMLVFGGGVNPSVVDWTNELWSLDLAALAWSRVASSSPGGPGDRAWASLVVDPVRDQLLIYGGQSESSYPMNEVWGLSLATEAWQLRTPDALTEHPVSAHVGWNSYWQPVLLDERNHRLILTGGQRSEGAAVDMWQLPTEGTPAWSAIPIGASIYPSLLQPAVYDPAEDRVVSPTGHYFHNHGYLDHLQTFTVADSARSSSIALSGPAPFFRNPFQLARDDSRGRLVLFGGRRYDSISPISYDYHDLWTVPLDGSGPWLQLSTEEEGATLPDGRVILDAPRDRLLLFPRLGGQVREHALWSSGPWNALGWVPEAIGDRLLVLDGPFSRLLAIDTFGRVQGLRLDANEDWEPVEVAGLPPQRIPAQANFDAATGRVFLYDGSITDNSVHVLELLSLPSRMLRCAYSEIRPGQVRLLWVGPATTRRASVYRRQAGDAWQKIAEIQRNSKSGQLGYEDRDAPPGTTEYRLGLQTAGPERAAGGITVQVPEAIALSLSGATANPSTDGLTVMLSLPDASPATLELLDVSGRRLLSREVGALGFGRHTLRLAGHELESGMYFLRLTRGGERRQSRAVVIR